MNKDLVLSCTFCSGPVTTEPPDSLSCTLCGATWSGEGHFLWSNVAPLSTDFDDGRDMDEWTYSDPDADQG